jgi:hypothetical protein
MKAAITGMKKKTKIEIIAGARKKYAVEISNLKFFCSI